MSRIGTSNWRPNGVINGVHVDPLFRLLDTDGQGISNLDIPPLTEGFLKCDGSGVLSWENSMSSYSLPAATTSSLGGVIVDSSENLGVDASGKIGFEFTSSLKPQAQYLHIGTPSTPVGVFWGLQAKLTDHVVINESYITGSSVAGVDFTLPNYTFSFPSSVGTAGEVLQTNGNGTSAWVAPSGGGTLVAATDLSLIHI